MARPDQTMPEGRKWQMGRLNVHKGHGWSTLHRTDTSALERNDPTNTHGWATSHSVTRCAQTNDATTEKMENGPPERAQGTWAVTT